MMMVDLSHEIGNQIQALKFKSHLLRFTSVEVSESVTRRSRTVDDLSLDDCFRSAVLLDTTDRRSGQIDDEDLEGAEESAGVAIREGEIVILQTGWENYYPNRRYEMGFPTLSSNAVDYLLFRRVAGIGVDTPSIDPKGSLSAHRKLLQEKAIIIENLCNLNRIGQNRFRLIALPLKVRVRRAPVRVIAVVDDLSNPCSLRFGPDEQSSSQWQGE